MTQGTIVDPIAVTLDTILTNTPHMDIGVLTNLSIFCIVMTSPAIHRKDSWLFPLITMVTGLALDIIFIRGGVGKMVKNNRSAIGLKGDLFGFGNGFEMIGIMTELATDRTLNMAIQAVLADTFLVNGLILTHPNMIFAVMTIPAIHLIGILVTGFIIVMTLLAGHILE